MTKEEIPRRFTLEGLSLGFWFDPFDRLIQIPAGWDKSWIGKSLGEVTSWAQENNCLLAEDNRLADSSFDPRAKARDTDPPTAKNAAFQNLPTKNTQRWIILKVHFNHPLGLTNHELEALINRDRIVIINDSLTTRVSELEQGGWLLNTGLKRMGNNGIEIAVWRITAKGLSEFGIEVPWD
jgi:hypothetical protein